MTGAHPAWLNVHRGRAPLLLSMPHSGTELPDDVGRAVLSPWLARRDTDWWVDTLYDFAYELGATVVRTSLSRTAIDLNRDPSGQSLYPGQATTGLCPMTTFDGEPLYRDGYQPDIEKRRAAWFDPYHAALAAEADRLRALHPAIVLYDCHSIRSVIPRLFEGSLPHFNIGTNSGASCAPALQASIEAVCDESGFSRVSNGRFRGGYITRFYGRPERGVHAVQMEMACRAYLAEPSGPIGPHNWPVPYDSVHADPVRSVLKDILQRCLTFAREHA